MPKLNKHSQKMPVGNNMKEQRSQDDEKHALSSDFFACLSPASADGWNSSDWEENLLALDSFVFVSSSFFIALFLIFWLLLS